LAEKKLVSENDSQPNFDTGSFGHTGSPGFANLGTTGKFSSGTWAGDYDSSSSGEEV
jgi:hypothetical protein